MQPELLKIKEKIEDLLRVMDFLGEAEVDETNPDFTRFNIKSPEAAFLIGRGGENLKAFQLISRAISSRLTESPIRFVVDVNDYQNSRLDLLKQLALSAAREVRQQRQAKFLEPMNSYERRIIHTVLSGEPGVKTESEGLYENRRIVIKPVDKTFDLGF